MCRKKEVVVSQESGTVIVNDDQDALQNQTRWNAWLEKGDHAEGGASIHGAEHTVTSTDYAASAAPTSSNLTVRSCIEGTWLWILCLSGIIVWAGDKIGYAVACLRGVCECAVIVLCLALQYLVHIVLASSYMSLYMRRL